MAKGSSYERAVCKQLSLWWTNGERDDVFWRASNSGGRATMRAARGKRTFGAYGDVAATDPVGLPLLQVFTIELKRGYSGQTFADLIDSRTPERRGWGQFIAQALKAYGQSGALSWMLIHRRDRREATVCISDAMCQKLCGMGALPTMPRIRSKLSLRFGKTAYHVRIFRLDDFLKRCDPLGIKRLADEFLRLGR